MLEFLASFLVFILHWLSMFMDGNGMNNSEFPIISTCDKYTLNTLVSSKECAYGYSGRFCDGIKNNIGKNIF